MSDDPLDQLYPFLSGGQKDPAQEQRALLHSVQQKVADSVAVKQRFFTANAETLIDAARTLADAYAEGGRLFTMGNGGSSCDASHLAVEFQHPVTAGRPALPAINLCHDTAMTSAVGNDVGFDQIFVRQLEAHGRPGDVLAGFSTSGNSENLMAAFRKAQALGLVTIGFAGGNGGQMLASGLLDHCLVVPTDSIHRVQESHVLCYHILWDLVHTLLADRRGSAAGNATSPSPQPSPPRGRESSSSAKNGVLSSATPDAQESAAPPSSPLSPRERGGPRGGEGSPTTRDHARAVRHNPTDAERHLWQRLRNRQLQGFKFRRQHPVGPYIVDFLCDQAKLVVELDGGQHQAQTEYDQERTRFLERKGYRVVRFWNDQVFKETEAVLEEILRRLNQESSIQDTPPPRSKT
ncbi:MAG: DUF559 domain-containing protein [Gammaproteobacteria bacterium]|nr:MAG: DUF559 domain-containing protein [Gammaproteobacteria bacterium]